MSKRKKERRIYQPRYEAAQPRRRKEWLELEGGDLCIWEMTVAEASVLAEFSQRPEADPRSEMAPIDIGEAMIWQIALSCYDGDEPDAKRIWKDEDIPLIRELPSHEFNQIVKVIGQVNGISAGKVAILEDFT